MPLPVETVTYDMNVIVGDVESVSEGLRSGSDPTMVAFLLSTAVAWASTVR